MSDELIRKYKSKELLELQTASVALADKHLKYSGSIKALKKTLEPGKSKALLLNPYLI